MSSAPQRAGVDLETLRSRLARFRPWRAPSWRVIRRAGVALVLRQRERQPELLFVERATRRGDPWSGNMAFPGGLAGRGDETTLATAIREAREEVGLDLASEADVLGRLSDRLALGPDARPLAITPHVFELTGEGEPRTSREVRDLCWIPLPRLLAGADRERHWVHSAGLPLRMAGIRYQQKLVWGLTLRMVVELRRVALGLD